MDQSDWIAIAAVLAAIASAAYASRGNAIAKRALQLAELQESRRTPAIDVYLDSGLWTRLPDNSQEYMYLVTISNPTDIDNSIARCELRFNYHRKGGLTTNFKVTSIARAPKLTVFGKTTLLDVPQHIPARGSTSGLVLFNVPAALVDGVSLESTSLVFTDANGLVFDLQSPPLKEVVDESGLAS